MSYVGGGPSLEADNVRSWSLIFHLPELWVMNFCFYKLACLKQFTTAPRRDENTHSSSSFSSNNISTQKWYKSAMCVSRSLTRNFRLSFQAGKVQPKAIGVQWTAAVNCSSKLAPWPQRQRTDTLQGTVGKPWCSGGPAKRTRSNLGWVS